MPEVPVWAVRLLRLLQLFERVLVICAFTVLVLVVFADVVSRELTGSGLYWASQVGVWANVIVVMAGFGIASASGAHLRPRFSDNWLPAGWQPALQTLQHFCMTVFCVLIGALSITVVRDSWQLGEVSLELFVPIWPVQVFLPLAFSIAAVRHALYATYPGLRPNENSALAMDALTGETRSKGGQA